MEGGNRNGNSEGARRRRLLFIITRGNLGGAQRHLAWLLDGLRGRYELDVVVGETGYLAEELARIGVRCRVLPCLRRNLSPFADLRTLRALRALVRSERPDLVHLHSFKAAMLGRVATLGLATPVVVTAHGWSFSDHNPRLRKWLGLVIERSLSALAARIIVVCRRDLDLALAKRIAPRQRLRLVLNGVPDEAGVAAAMAQREGRDDDAVRLVNVGRLCQQKNQQLLVGLMPWLPPQVSLTLVGDGPDRAALASTITRLGLDHRVTVRTGISEPHPLLCEADVYVSTSLWEGLSLGAIEALRAGLPVVASAVGGADELVEHRSNGFVHPVEDADAFVRSLRRLAAERTLRQTMGRRSRETYLARYSSTDFVAATIAVYEELLADASTSR